MAEMLKRFAVRVTDVDVQPMPDGSKDPWLRVSFIKDMALSPSLFVNAPLVGREGLTLWWLLAEAAGPTCTMRHFVGLEFAAEVDAAGRVVSLVGNSGMGAGVIRWDCQYVPRHSAFPAGPGERGGCG